MEFYHGHELTSYQLKGRSNMSSNQEGSFQIFPLVTSSVSLAAFFIGKCLALCFVIVYRKSARFREPRLGWILRQRTRNMKFNFLIFKLIKK